MRRRLFFLAALAALSAPAAAQPRVQLGLRDVWVRQPPPGAPTAAGYLTIINAGRAEDRLLSVSTPSAQQVQVHEMSMAGGIMRMRAVSGGVVVPAGRSVTLRPGGAHLMLIGFRQPAAPRVALTLRFERAGVLHATAPIRLIGR